jgi:glycosyltransferase involved in cell wall biosynthesis
MKSQAALVSVGMPVFNSGKTIALAVASIVRQSYQNWELLVMDDGSTDDTVEIVQRFGDPRVRIVVDGVHRGLPTQLNRAVDMARGRYFARMDGDDIAYPDRVLRQVEYLESHPEVDLLASEMIVFRSDGSILGTRRSPQSHAALCRHPWRGIRMSHPTWMGRIEWFRENPYSSEAHRMEDRELLLRTHARSCFATLPEILVAYREDFVSLRRILFARKNTCKVLLRYARDNRAYAWAVFGIVAEIGKSCVDAVALGTGLKYRLLRHRAQSVTERELSTWDALWTSLSQRDSAEQKSLAISNRSV